MGRDKAGKTHTVCASCGTGPVCGVCGGLGHWESKPEIKCSHCAGSGRCPLAR